MSKSIKVSAPGKLMLLGEHAVVYGKPCIVTAVNQRLSLKAEKLDTPEFILEAPDVEITNYRKSLKEVGTGDIPKGAKFVEVALANFLRKHKIKGGVKFSTVSQFKATFGFGSSSASAVCTIKALFELFKEELAYKQSFQLQDRYKQSLKDKIEREIFDLSYKTVIDIQGVGSGFDLAAAIYGGTLYYVYPGKVIRPLSTNLQIVVGYTGIKTDTPTVVKAVKEKINKYPKIYESIFNEIETLVKLSDKAIAKKDFETLGEIMNMNQGYLETIGVGSEKLSAMIYAARAAGAMGAKLSGAGIGDCMFALVEKKHKQSFSLSKKAVVEAITKAGGQVLDVEINAPGVRIEK